MLEERVFKTDGRKLHYQTAGDAGRTVLLLHGAHECYGVYDAQVPVIVNAGWRVVIPHRAGRGKSDPYEGPLTLAKEARDAWALMDHLHIERVVAAGHSQGAFVAQQMYLTRPECFIAVVSIDSAAFGKFNTRKMGLERYSEETRALYEKHYETLKELNRLWDYPSDFNVDKLMARRKVERKNPEAYGRLTQVPDPENVPEPEGKYVKVPLLAFAAGRGRVMETDPEVPAVSESLPAEDARLVVVPNSGHWVQEENSELFNEKLLEFLSRF